MNSDNRLRKYAGFWSKYRPAVLKLMQGTFDEVQQYQFMKHELSSIEKKPKGGFEFRMVIFNSKATRDTTDSEIAADLLDMLKLSQTGSTLIAANRYEIILDKKQLLRVSRQGL